MAERSPNYVLILVITILTAVGAHWARGKPSVVLYQPDLSAISPRLGRWEGKDISYGAEVMKALNADVVLSRAYTNLEYGSQASLLIVYRKYGRRDFIHRPEECYPSSGWTIVQTGTTTVPYAGREVPATKVIAVKDGARDMVVYWFASGTRTESNYMKQQLWMALDRFQTRKYGWAFIRINSPVTSSDGETMEDIRSFARQVSDPLLKCLTAAPGKG